MIMFPKIVFSQFRNLVFFVFVRTLARTSRLSSYRDGQCAVAFCSQAIDLDANAAIEILDLHLLMEMVHVRIMFVCFFVSHA